MCFCHTFLILFETMAECTCILHIGKPSKDTVKRFDDTSWAKVMAAKDVRMLSVKSKYSSLCTSLPETYSTSDGYHSSCYKNFTAVPKCPQSVTPKPASAEHPQRSSVTRSSVKHLEKTCSGVFQSTCIFCSRQRKTINHKVENVGSCETFNAEQAV